MDRKIKVILVNPLERARVVTVDHTLENMQRLVDDHIQVLYPWSDPVAIVAGDNAKLDGKPANRLLEDYDLICGPFFITGLSRDDLASVPDDLTDKYLKKFLYPEMFMKTMDGHLVQFKLGSDQPPRQVF